MRLGWQEIRARARGFSGRWATARFERGETQSFYNEFFAVFGVDRKKVAIFERRVEMIERGRRGFIDLFWPGVLVVEHKSAGRDLVAAEQQAFDYILGLKERDAPRYVLTCDFQRFRLLDLETRVETRFTLPELYANVEAFGFVMGVERRDFGGQAAVNIKAAELMGTLHDALEASGYRGHDLERLLVRLLFCLFADDTGIFEGKDDFLFLVEERTAADGHDVGRWLNDLFDVLDTPRDARQSTLDRELDRFPYINGALFTERLRTAHFDATMRDDLIAACRFDWGQVSPAIFGSLFQSVMAPAKRRRKGAHYTTEANILKLIGPLFLDELTAEFDRLKARRDGARRQALLAYQERLAGLNFLDPACGCGNFLVVTYRALRALELAVLEEVYPRAMSGTGEARRQGVLDIAALGLVSVEQFFGIEYEEFPAYIAEVAMWMADHLANGEMGQAFGTSFARIPLTQSAHIRHGDALEIDWAEVLAPERCFAVIGNPPFVGAKFQSVEQRAQVRRIADLGKSGGTLDYVCAWFIRAAKFLYLTSSITGDSNIGEVLCSPGRRVAGSPEAARIGFVSTNSIVQGEQVAQLWPILFRMGVEIAFAHRTFAWGSDARGKAHVHVVIIGLMHRDAVPREKRLFSYAGSGGEADETRHAALTAYLFDAGTVANRHLVVKEEPRPINGAAKIIIGSKPIDGGYLIFTPGERAALSTSEPEASRYLHPYVGADEFINGGQRWIAVLHDVAPDVLRRVPTLMARVGKVRAYRLGEIPAKGKADGTQKPPGTSALLLAATPLAFHVTVIPKHAFLVIPEVSSERRDYIPIGWLEPPVVPSNKLRLLADASLWDFGIITSRMHMAWTGHIGGRLKSDYQYGIGLNYNTFPWPDASPAQREKVEALAQGVLDARAAWPTACLADLYDPDTMPAPLRAAHRALDAAVDRLYRREPFAGDRDRVEHLFGRYETLVRPLEREGVRQNRRVARRRV